MNDAEISCICCSGKPRYRGSKHGHKLYSCPDCQLLFVHPLPDFSLQIYTDDYFAGAKEGFGYTDYDADKEPMKDTFLVYLKRISHYHRLPGKRLFDVGAATGFFLNLARAEGFDVAGVEPADYAAGIARGKGLDVKTGILEQGLLSPESFDVITMWDVIEHVPDPRATMSQVYEALRPGGILAINTPNSSSLYARVMGLRWHLVVPPEHLFLFGEPSLRELLKDKGFEWLESGAIGKSFTTQYVFSTLFHWLGIKWMTWFLNFLTRSGIGQWRMPINLRDNITVFARKR
jgi:spore maturation protein CgeB